MSPKALKIKGKEIPISEVTKKNKISLKSWQKRTNGRKGIAKENGKNIGNASVTVFFEVVCAEKSNMAAPVDDDDNNVDNKETMSDLSGGVL